jgi:hypothetical protein
MKALTEEQIKTRDRIAQSLNQVSDAIRQQIADANEAIATAQDYSNALHAKYRSHLLEAKNLMESVHDEQEAFYSERSDAWQICESGQAYQFWMDEWSRELDEAGMPEFPDLIEEPEFDAAGVLMDLQVQP